MSVARPSYETDNLGAADAPTLLAQHLETMLDDPSRWASLIDEHAVWELAYAPSLGHPAVLEGRTAMTRHAAWFRDAVSGFRFYDARISPMADENAAVVQVRGEGTIRETGRVYRQEYVVFLRSKNGKIVHLREYFDPLKAAHAMGIAIGPVT